MQVFSTDRVPSQDAFAYWREVLTQHFIHLRPERTEQRRFSSTIEAGDLNGLSFSRVKAGVQNVHRGRPEIARSPHDLVFLNLHVAGKGSFLQGGEERPLGCGDIFVIDAVRPFQLGCASDVVQLSLKFPRSMIARLVPDGHEVGGFHIEGRRRVGALIASYMSALWRWHAESCTGAQPDAVEHLLDLTAYDLRVRRGETPLPRDAFRTAVYVHVCRMIRKRCPDPHFTPASAATASGVPLRTLQAVFAHQGDAVSRRIQSERIALAAALLKQDGMRAQTVSAIAMMSGFSDVTHFSHAFARAYGDAPSRWRRRMWDA